jgi:ribosomal protein L37AE/L43A
MIIPTIRTVCPWCRNKNAWISSDGYLRCNKCGKTIKVGALKTYMYWKGNKLVKKVK